MKKLITALVIIGMYSQAEAQIARDQHGRALPQKQLAVAELVCNAKTEGDTYKIIMPNEIIRLENEMKKVVGPELAVHWYGTFEEAYVYGNGTKKYFVVSVETQYGDECILTASTAKTEDYRNQKRVLAVAVDIAVGSRMDEKLHGIRKGDPVQIVGQIMKYKRFMLDQRHPRSFIVQIIDIKKDTSEEVMQHLKVQKAEYAENLTKFFIEIPKGIALLTNRLVLGRQLGLIVWATEYSPEILPKIVNNQ